ncbi:amidase [Anatilimnocola floriformis]|uniref:amidase n=1 Tax=Anatilimnocola floriformis TaxID=2948575 RepID=UPI0020C4A3D0|nr:amidase [Anatilimnocola floriformis]
MPGSSDLARPFSRRHVLAALATLGVGTAAFQRALAAQAEQAGRVTPELIDQAAWIAGIQISEDDRQAVADAVQRDQRKFAAIRKVELKNSVPPALSFFAAPPPATTTTIDRQAIQPLPSKAAIERPDNDDDLAFLPVTKLAALLKAKKITSTELTKLYLARLKKYDAQLKCVVTLTEELALKQAAQADEEIAAGKYRGPLHGMPWGAKDIIAVPGYKTTWGAGHYQEQAFDAPATVVRRLDEAGAVLVAKLTVGSLALGDEWFGGMTRNPWNTDEGSSGSSAGSTAAVVAGLVGFALGSETLGSIISPCRRCSASGLRPTFGRVSRAGCMTLSWSMDKIGPIARSIEDCALIFGAIHGSDPQDITAVDRPFAWPAATDIKSLKVGYFAADDRPAGEKRAVDPLKELGVTLVPMQLPRKYPVGPLTLILNTEAAAAFDDLTRDGVREGIGHWGTTFRQGQFVPAVEYLRACRVRTLVMQEMAQAMEGVDAYVGGDDLTLTNFTGHPTVIIPDGEREDSKSGQPDTITFTGTLFGESKLLALAHAYQQTTAAHWKRPKL